MTDPTFGQDVSAGEFFVKGGCHQLALALVSLIEGAAVVGVYDQLAEDGAPIDVPRLIHAGALVGDVVIDVEGVIFRDAWVEAWSDMARAALYAEWDPDEPPYGFTSPAHERFSMAVATRLLEVHRHGISFISGPRAAAMAAHT